MSIENIRQMGVALVALFGLFLFMGIYHTYQENPTQENLNKLIISGVPDEVWWLKELTETFSNPIILLLGTGFIVWFFGYFQKNPQGV